MVQPQIAYLFVFDTMSDWEPGFAVAGINNPQFQRSPGALCVKTASVRPRPVRTIGGVTVLPDITLEEVQLDQAALLILPGGLTWDRGENLEAVALAQQFVQVGKTVAAICGATSGLAKAGLLDTREHTSNSRDYIAATGYAGLKNYRDTLVVRDRGVITAPGTAPLEFAREIFAALELYAPPVLEAWYKLFKTADSKYFGALMRAAGA